MYTWLTTSYCELPNLHRVYNQKTKKPESVREIEESKQLTRDADPNQTTGLMNESLDHKDRSDQNSTPTKTLPTNDVDNNLGNVDSGQI